MRGNIHVFKLIPYLLLYLYKPGLSIDTIAYVVDIEWNGNVERYAVKRSSMG